ncbi:hypothetical protein VTN96DRAFT_7163 [Rasamsonia emersonii]
MTAFPWPEIPTASGRVCVKDDDAIVGSRVTFADATRCTCVSRGIEFLLFCSSSQQLLALPAQPGLWRAFAKNRSNSGAILPRDPFTPPRPRYLELTRIIIWQETLPGDPQTHADAERIFHQQ